MTTIKKCVRDFKRSASLPTSICTLLLTLTGSDCCVIVGFSVHMQLQLSKMEENKRKDEKNRNDLYPCIVYRYTTPRSQRFTYPNCPEVHSIIP